MFICCVFPDNVFPLLWVGVLCRVVSLRLSLLCFRVSRVGRRGLVCVLGIKGGGGACVASLPLRGVLVRRRATLPHPVGCSTIAVPGLRFRVRNGSGRLPWAMAAANL